MWPRNSLTDAIIWCAATRFAGLGVSVGLRQQLLGQRLEDPQVAANRVEERQPPQHREELGRVPELLADLARARRYGFSTSGAAHP